MNTQDNKALNEAAEKYIPDNLVVKVEARDSKGKLSHYDEMILKCNVVEIIAKILAQLQLNKQVSTVWVKASERLPEIETTYSLRIDGKPGFGKWYNETKIFGFEATNGFGSLNTDNFHLVEWLDETQSQQISLSDDEIEKMADKEYELYTYNKDERKGYIKGAKAISAALQQKSVVGDNGLAFSKWLEENTQVIREDKITLYRYFDNSEWGNYILEDIYKEYKEKL